MFWALCTSAGLLTSTPDTHWVSLQWDKSESPEVVGYQLYWGTESRNYDRAWDVGSVTRATISGLHEGTNYFFALRAYDASGNEGDFSDEISYTAPPAEEPMLYPSCNSNGIFALSFYATPFSEWTVLLSRDFVQWQPLSSVIIGPTGYAEFQERLEPAPRGRYFRLQRIFSSPEINPPIQVAPSP